MRPFRLLALSLMLAITASCTHRATAQQPPADQPAAPPGQAEAKPAQAEAKPGQAEAQPATQPGQTRKLEHITVDVRARQVRVDCQALGVDAPLEFLCVRAGGPEHEAVLRTRAKPSDIHLGLLMVGLQPGQPVRYSEPAQRWFPPSGPPVRIWLEFEKDGKKVRASANRLMRNVRTRTPMPESPWIFVGSQVMDDGNYAADVTGYIISVVNFDLTVIDVPDLRSNANETLEWEADLEALPAEGTAVTMILEPVGQPAEGAPGAAGDAAPGAAAPGAGQGGDGAAAAGVPAPIDVVLVEVKADESILYNREAITLADLADRLSREKALRPLAVRIGTARNGDWQPLQAVIQTVRKAGIEPEVVLAGSAPREANSAAGVEPGPRADVARMQALRQRWEKAVKPNADALRHAAQSHYDVIMSLRQEQQRLIDEADKIQRLIEDLERDYQDITTPRPMQ